jgi:predicted nucleic acid-binding protein
MMVVVDTPAWSLALRRKATDLTASERQFTQMLHQLVEEGRVQLLGSVRQELLSGLREEAQFRRLRNYLRDFPDIALVAEDYEEAARASNQCRQSGIASSPVDMLICAVALRRDWQILSTDADFAHYGRAIPLRFLPVIKQPPSSS